MSVRPRDWTPIGLSSDPTPGDPAVVLRAGRDYGDIADAISSAETKLRRLDRLDDTALAVEALRDKSGDVADNIAKAHERYRATADALTTYAPALESAQDEADAALAQARAAQDDADSAASASARYQRLADATDDEDEKKRYEHLADDDGDAGAARAKLSAAKQRLHAAIDDRDRAAERAVADIREITDHDDLNDGWWDDWGADLLKIITEVAGWVSAIAGILALLVCWIPVIGQLLGSALLLIAAVSAVINALGSIILAATGEMSWTEAIISVVGAVLSCVGMGGAVRVVLSEGARAVTAVRAGMEVNALAKVEFAAFAKEFPQFVGKGGTTWHPMTAWGSIKIGPAQWSEALSQWRTALPELAELDGKSIFRMFDSNTSALGGSWTPFDPRGFDFVRSTTGLPDSSVPEFLVEGVLDDVSHITTIRHALPFDGNPGGLVETVIPGGANLFDKGVVGATQIDFTLPAIAETVGGTGIVSGAVPAVGGLLQVVNGLGAH